MKRILCIALAMLCCVISYMAGATKGNNVSNTTAPIIESSNFEPLCSTSPLMQDSEHLLSLTLEFDRFYGDYPEISLQDLSIYPNLQSLQIYNATITDVENIDVFYRLEKLELVHCGLTDVGSIGKLQGLTHLNLEENKIRDISSLSNLINLESLNLSWNDLKSLQALESMKKLKVLDLSGTSSEAGNTTSAVLTERYEGIAGLSSLECLKLSGNNLTSENIQPLLVSMPTLKELDVSNNLLESLQPLKGSVCLTTLNAEGNPITSLEGIEELEQLRQLNVSSCNISSLEPIAHLKQLNELLLFDSISYDQYANQIYGYEALTELNHLRKLAIDYDDIPKLNVLSKNEDLLVQSFRFPFLSSWLTVDQAIKEYIPDPGIPETGNE